MAASVSRVWVAGALTPLGWSVGIIVRSFDDGGHAGTWSLLLGLLSVLAWVAAPTLAVVAAVDVLRTHGAAAVVAGTVAAAAMLFSLLLMPVVGFGMAAILLAWLVVGLGLLQALPRRPS